MVADANYEVNPFCLPIASRVSRQRGKHRCILHNNSRPRSVEADPTTSGSPTLDLRGRLITCRSVPLSQNWRRGAFPKETSRCLREFRKRVPAHFPTLVFD